MKTFEQIKNGETFWVELSGKLYKSNAIALKNKDVYEVLTLSPSLMKFTEFKNEAELAEHIGKYQVPSPKKNVSELATSVEFDAGKVVYKLIELLEIKLESLEDEEIILVPKHITFVNRCGIIGLLINNGKSVFEFNKNNRYFNIIYRYVWDKSVKCKLEKVDFEDLKPGDWVLDDISDKGSIAHYSLFVNKEEIYYYESGQKTIQHEECLKDYEQLYKVVPVN